MGGPSRAGEGLVVSDVNGLHSKQVNLYAALDKKS